MPLAADTVVRGRQQHLKCSPVIRFARQMDRSAQTVHDSLHDSQSKSAASGFRGKERVEYLGLRLRGHAAAGVGNLQLQVLAIGQRSG